MLEAGKFKEAWYHFARWYRQSQGKQDHPTREGLDQESVDREELYICRPPARIKNPIFLQPEAVIDDIYGGAGAEKWESRSSVGHESGGPEGVAQGGQS